MSGTDPLHLTMFADRPADGESGGPLALLEQVTALLEKGSQPSQQTAVAVLLAR
jgi:hypothetical protein